MYYEIRIEPRKHFPKSEIINRIEDAFDDVGLSAEGVEILDID